MKKLLLLGVIALGSMSFVEGDVDCFDIANKVVDSFRENNFSEATNDAIWDYIFYSCLEENGQLLDEVVVIIE